MSRYIDADALIKELDMTEDLSAYDAVVFEEMVKNMPTADVVEVKHGKWIEGGYQDQGYPCICSVCGIAQDIKAKFLFSFCPNCGSDMRERRKTNGN